MATPTNEQDAKNILLLKIISMYMKEAPGLRFGQILLNLDINQFADSDAPGSPYRDIQDDTSDVILKRANKAFKEAEEEF